MRKPWQWAAALLAGAATVLAQEPPRPVRLTDLMQALQFAELVRAAGFSREQLSALAGLQGRWRAVEEVPEEAVTAMREVCFQVANGRSIEAAVASVGVGEEFREAQEQFHRTSQALAAELRDLLRPEQRRALLAYTSPERGLAGLVEGLRQARKAPEPAWGQIRKDMAEAMTGFAGPRGSAAVPAETIAGWLDRVREMGDADFEKAAPDLPGQWARALAPEMMRQMDDPRNQEQRLLEVCRRLIAEPAGPELLARLIEQPAPEAPRPPPPAP